MWTADNLALLQPLLRDRAENAQGLHALARVEDVVNDALEVVCVVGVGHHFGGVGRGQLESVDELLLVAAVAQHLHQALCIPGCGEYKFSTRTNIQIYLYPKNDTNDYPNIFVSKKQYK